MQDASCQSRAVAQECCDGNAGDTGHRGQAVLVSVAAFLHAALIF